MSIQSAHRSNDENTRPHSGSASSREADLGSAPIGSLLFKLALPAIAAQIINVLYNMVDRMYIGHIPDIGPSALTGVGVTMPIIMCISAFAALAAMGGAPQASILMSRALLCPRPHGFTIASMSSTGASANAATFGYFSTEFHQLMIKFYNPRHSWYHNR